MLDQLLAGAKSELTKQISSKFQLDSTQAEKAAATTKDTVQAGLMKEVASGNISGLTNLLNSGGAAGNPIVANLSKQVVDNLTSKLGLSPQIASAISTFAIPFILGKISGNKTGGFDASTVTKMFGGGNLADSLQGAAGKALGGKLGKFFK